MAASEVAQDVGNYEVNHVKSPDENKSSEVWYYESPSSLEFHLDLFSGQQWRGHVTFRVSRSKLLASLKRMGNS